MCCDVLCCHVLCYFFFFCSNRKFAKVMRYADINTNGAINRHELNLLLFPAREAQCEISVSTR
jgi:hypothetical protein